MLISLSSSGGPFKIRPALILSRSVSALWMSISRSRPVKVLTVDLPALEFRIAVTWGYVPHSAIYDGSGRDARGAKCIPRKHLQHCVQKYTRKTSETAFLASSTWDRDALSAYPAGRYGIAPSIHPGWRWRWEGVRLGCSLRS